MDRPTAAPRFAHLMLGDLALQGGQVKHLAGLDHDRCTQGALTDSADTCGVMDFDPIRLRHALQGMTRVSRLSSRRLLAPAAQRFRLGFVQPVRRRRLAGVTAVFRQSTLQFGHFGGQIGNLRGQVRHLRAQRPQLPNQGVFVRNAQTVKIG